MAEKSTSPKSKKNNSETFLWLAVGCVLIVLIALIGFVVLQKLTEQKKPLANEFQPTSAPLATATLMQKATQNYTAILQSTPCQFKIPDQVQVTCGIVEVPEDRNGDVKDTIHIAVAVFHSTSSTPKPDPILYLQGGPGDKAIDWIANNFSTMVLPYLAERDFIVFDPRGVGYSEPRFDCDDFKTTYLQDLQGKIPTAQKVSYYQGALLACKNNLVQAGVNLSAYTSIDTSADAKDILVALGYQQANLYGISYGTRLGQLIMRDYPGFVRSAILDSVVPVEVQMFNQSTTEKDSALHVLFEDCKANPDCSSAYPDLEQTYNEVVAQFNTQPITLTFPTTENKKLEELVDGSTFHDVVLWSLRTPQMIALTPSLVYRTRNGDYSMLKLALAYPILSLDSISTGIYISVNCHDQIFAMSTEKLDHTIYDLCNLWDIRPLAEGENDPVNSEIPTLIIAGKYDPVTPPSFARQLAGHLTHSYIAEIPDQGHAPSASGISDCPTRVISAFLQDQNTSPNLTCIQEINAIQFMVPYSASNPLTLESTAIDNYHINTDVPAGWNKAEYGFYNRAAWFGDMTQIGIQKAAVPEKNWISWLASNFGGNQGLDQPAVPFDQRQANGLTWSLYKTKSMGYPVDIAFAKSGTQTLMILMISYSDERDALYDTVFLPIIDATTSSK